MAGIQTILNNVAHRPWKLPQRKWSFYQEWKRALFLHWKASRNSLIPFIPENIALDTFEGECWVSLVAFSMEKVRPRLLPSFPMISNFHEINVRTYLRANEKSGVYFLSIEAEKYLSASISRKLSGLPYEKSDIKRNNENQLQTISSRNEQRGFNFHAAFEPGTALIKKDPLETWLTEKYCLYDQQHNQLFRYEVHHAPWPLYKVSIQALTTDYTIGTLSLNKPPDLAHYSSGVKVIGWKKELLTDSY